MTLPSPDNPSAPKFWRYETSGALEGPIVRYLEGRLLTTADITLIRLYLKQWIESPVWLMNPAGTKRSQQTIIELRQRAKLISTKADIEAWLRDALAIGIDPL